MDDVTSSSSSPSVSVPEEEQQKTLSTGDECGDGGGADVGGACGVGDGLGGDSFDVVVEDTGDDSRAAEEGASEELLQFDLPSIVSMDDVLIALRDCSLLSGPSSGEDLR